MKSVRIWLSMTMAVLMAVHLAPASAAVVETDDVAAQAAQSATDAERAKVRAFVERADLREKLQLLGIDSLQAARRVDAMTSEEVHALAQKIDALPAGGAFSHTDIIIILLVVILVVLVV